MVNINNIKYDRKAKLKLLTSIQSCTVPILLGVMLSFMNS